LVIREDYEIVGVINLKEKLMRNNAIVILIANDSGQEDSFVFYLHEKNYFHENSYWDLYNSIVDIIELTKNKQHLDREITKMISKVFSFIFRSFMWNFCSYDQYSINGLPSEDKFPDYIERLEFVYRAYFESRSVREESFEIDELINPRYKTQ